VPFPVYPIIGGDIQERMKWGAYSQFSGTRTYRKQIVIFRKNVEIAVRFLVIFIRIIRTITSHNPIQGAITL
jgi:hypothetical protein